jgi:hypothetical protein
VSHGADERGDGRGAGGGETRRGGKPRGKGGRRRTAERPARKPSTAAFRRAAQRALAAALRRGPVETAALAAEDPVAELLALAPGERRVRAVSDERLHTPEALLRLEARLGRQVEAGDARAEEQARLGLLAAECLDPVRFPHGLVNDLRAVFWRLIARRRLAAGLAGAALEPLATAEALVEVGSGDPYAIALVDTDFAAFHAGQGDLCAAAGRLRRSAERYAEAGEEGAAGMALVVVSGLLALEGERTEALATARRARGYLSGEAAAEVGGEADELIARLAAAEAEEPIH